MTEDQLVKGMEIAAQRGAQYNIEVLDEEIIPTLMILTENDRIELAHILVEKEDMADTLKELLLEKQAKAYALILEAWQTSFVEKALEYEGRVREMPLDDRFECTTLILVRKNKGIVKYLSAKIDTDANGRRKLRDWETGNVQETRICITEW